MLADLAYAWRSLIGAPRFTIAALLSLAISIGANTAVFSLVNAQFSGDVPYNAELWLWGGLATGLAAASRMQRLRP